MRQIWKRLLAATMALCLTAMCAVTSFAADQPDPLLVQTFGTSDPDQIAASAVEEWLEDPVGEETTPAQSELEPNDAEVSTQADVSQTPDAEEEQETEDGKGESSGDESDVPEQPAPAPDPDAQKATVEWETADGVYEASAAYPYTGKAIRPAYQLRKSDGTLLTAENPAEHWFSDADFTRETDDFINCGTLYLRLTAEDGSVIAEGSYSITPITQSITGVQKSYSKYYNISFQLSPRAQGELTFKSANTKVAKVSRTGKVTITGMGTTQITITAAATRNYQKASCKVTVKGIPRAQTLKVPASLTKKYANKGTFSLGAKANGGGTLRYQTSNPDVVTVSAAGKCTMKGTGTAVITVTAPATAYFKKASAKVNVTVYTTAKRLSYSSSYRSRKYYRALMALRLTGTRRSNVVSIALSQLGYHEGKSSSQLGGNGKGSGNHTEYGRYYGLTYGAWCAMFVNWCAREADISTKIIPKYCAVRDYYSFYHRGGRKFYSWAKVRKKQYQPQKGDLIMYAYSKGGTAHHIGYVISSSYANGKVTITTVEGNTSDQVRKVTFRMKQSSSAGKVNGHYILGVAHPNY